MADATLYFEDVAEGDEAPELTHVLTRTDLVAYAGASADYNPMHHDEVKATAAGQPSATPPAPSSTARLVNPSVRACRPSATKAALPIRRPTRIRYWATTSLPAKPTTAAAATAHR